MRKAGLPERVTGLCVAGGAKQLNAEKAAQLIAGYQARAKLRELGQQFGIHRETAGLILRRTGSKDAGGASQRSRSLRLNGCRPPGCHRSASSSASASTRTIGLGLRPEWRRVVPAIPGSCGSSLRASPAGSSGRCRGGSLRRRVRTLRGSRPGPRCRGRRRSSGRAGG